MNAAYFDDFADASFKLFFHQLQTVKEEVFTEFKVTMSAGKAGRYYDNKPMGLLGLVLHVMEAVLAHDLSKARRYSALAKQLVQTARKSGFVPNEMMDRLEGQFRFSSEADPGLVGDLLCIRAALGTNFARKGGKTRVSEQACQLIERMAERMQLGMAVCFQPRGGKLGSTGLPLLTGWTDASGAKTKPIILCSECCPGGQGVRFCTSTSGLRCRWMSVEAQMNSEKYFFGWGGMFYLEGTNTVFITQQFVTYNARNSLDDSTALECCGTNEGLCIMARVRDQGPVDMIQIADNQADVGIANVGKPRQVAERILFAQRVQLRDTMAPTIVVAHHVLRDRMPEADFLSRHLILRFMDAQGNIEDQSPEGRVAAGLLRELHVMINTRFGCYMHLRPVWPEPWEDARARLAVVIRAKGSAGADGLCSLGASDAAVRPWPRRSVSSQLIHHATVGDSMANPGKAAETGRSAGTPGT